MKALANAAVFVVTLGALAGFIYCCVTAVLDTSRSRKEAAWMITLLVIFFLGLALGWWDTYLADVPRGH